MTKAGRPKGSQFVKICPGCNNTFEVPPSLKDQQFCSRRCRADHKIADGSSSVRQMSPAEIAWFAGLLDGEGSIILAHRNRDGSRAFRLQISNTVVPLLERIREYTGVGVIRETTRSVQNPKHARGYIWTVNTGEGLEILRQVRPWLIVKADRADAVLEGKSFDRQSRWDDIYD